ncbi:hypothetical protein ACFVFS_39325 [Kitasatospora sp. NPDC057692]|uniref:hypothetical protein n=1 Tax=Kitasatospora sp. NPDC057692 TaxID=3346215 RepID=UPI0036A38F4D
MIVDWSYTKPYFPVGVIVRVAVASVIAVALTWQFLSIDISAVDLTTDYASNRQVVVYMLTYLSFVLWSSVEIAFFCGSMALVNWRRSQQPAAFGQLLTAIGGAFCVAFTFSKGGYLIAYQLHHPWPLATEKALSSPLVGLYILLVLVGLCLATLHGNRATSATTTATTAAVDA